MTCILFIEISFGVLELDRLHLGSRCLRQKDARKFQESQWQAYKRLNATARPSPPNSTSQQRCSTSASSLRARCTRDLSPDSESLNSRASLRWETFSKS